jgi:hypothetical protein
MPRILLAALAGSVALGLLFFFSAPDVRTVEDQGPGTAAVERPTESARFLAEPPTSAAASLAWQPSAERYGESDLRVSGLEEFPGELIRKIQPLPRPIGDRVHLDLGAAGEFRGRVERRVVHGNGDATLILRSEPDGVPEAPAGQAVLTWGESGLFGRIQDERGLYLVHSDAAGSWLIDTNDPRIDVDVFEHDTLGQSALARHHHAHAGSADDIEPGPETAEPVYTVNSSAPASTSLASSDLASQRNAIVIDVLFAYPPSMQQRYPGSLLDTRLNHLVSIANQTFVDSEVPIAVRLVGQQLVDYSASQANAETLQNLRNALAGESAVAGLQALASRRDQLGADIVAFTWPHDIETRGSCGIAFFPVFENGSYDASYGVHIDNDGFSNWSVCSDAVFTHELGHNLNAEHQRAQSSGDDPNRSNYAFIQIGRYHTIMGSFGSGDQDRYRRLDRFSNPGIQCGGAPCGSSRIGTGSNNAAEISTMALTVAAYRSPVESAEVDRPEPLQIDQDGDGVIDRDDPFPFDPFNGQGDPDPAPPLAFEPRALAGNASERQELLVVSSGTDEVLAFSPEGEFRSVAVRPERVNPGPILSDFSDLLVDDEGRIYLLSSADVRRYDRLSGRLIDVFLGSRRPQPNDLLSPFPRALTMLPNNQLVVLGDSAIERYNASTGARLTQLTGDPTTDPAIWNERLDLSLRASAQWALKLYVAEATENRILRFSAASGAREPDLAPAGNGVISDPRDLAFDAGGLLYLANGSAGNVLRFDPGANVFLDEFVPAGSGGLSFARALAFGPQGDLYVADREQNAVLRFDGESGEFLGFAVEPGQNGLDQPEAIAFVGEIDQTVAGTSGHFFAPERAGEGWLVERLDDQTAAVSWFTYPSEGSSSEQAWLVGVGAIEGTELRFEEVLVTRGQGFGTDYDPDSFEFEVWGDLTLRFHDCNSGVARWRGPEGWGSGERRFDRLIEIPGLPCGDRTKTATSERPGISGQWFEPSRSGQGWFLQEVAPGQLFTAWYSYDAAGNQFWLVGSGEIDNGVARFDEMLRPIGTSFGDAFDPGAVELLPWGSLTITFSDCFNAVAEYSALDPAIGTGLLFPERLSQLDSLDCEVP